MKQFKQYQRSAVAELRPVEEHEAMMGFDPELNISISKEDLDNGSPKLGDMVARNPKNHNDQWLVAKEYFEANFSQLNANKTLGNTCANGTTKNVKDVVFWGNGDTFELISKASSESEGWMKSTKAMDTNNGVVVQVTTQQRNPDGSYSLAEALTFVPEASIYRVTDGDGKVISRSVWRD